MLGGKNYCLYCNFITNSWQGGQSSTIETMESIKNTYRARRGKRKSRNGAKSKRGGIPWRVDISERPAIADQKTEIGHWESDTMIGGNHLGVLVTYMDKASKFLVAGLAKNKTASEINRVTEKLFQEIHPDKKKPLLVTRLKNFVDIKS